MLDILPDSLLFRILCYLSYRELESLRLTSKSLHYSASDPLLWTRYPVTRSNITKNISKFVRDARFQKMKHLNLRAERSYHLPAADLSSLFNYIASNQHLASLKFDNCDLSSVPGFPFSKALGRTPSISVEGCNLTTEQAVALLSEVAKIGVRLTYVNLAGNCLEHVPSKLISSAAQLIEHLDLSLTDLNWTQVSDVLSCLERGESVTQHLALSDLNLELVDPTLLGRSVCHLRSLRLSECCLSEEQKQQLFSHLAGHESTLDKELDVSAVSLSSVEPGLLRQGLRGVQTINLQYCWLSLVQIQAILDGLAEWRAEHLNLSGNDCSRLSCEDLLTAASQLLSVNFISSRIQKETILEFIAVQGEEKSCLVVLSTSDFPTSYLQEQLRAAPCIQLTKGELPFYQDEQSCSYGEERGNFEPLPE